MRDFKYRHLLTRTPSIPGHIASLKTDFLKPWLSLFESNLQRTANLAVMPAMIATYVRRDQVFLSNANFRLYNKGEYSLEEVLNQVFTIEMEAELTHQLEAFDRDPNALDRYARGPFGCGFIEGHLTMNNRGMQSGMDAIFSSIVMESWTAFESLSSDLWVSAIDEGPRVLGNTVVNNSKQLIPSDSITVKILRELEYDARKELGMFLRETRRVSFQTLDKMKTAYSIAFGEAAEKLFKDTNNGYIDALSAFRNIFAHKLGKADKEFFRSVQKFAEFRGIKVDEQIYLDGEVVSKLRDAAMLMGIALVKFVDDFIVADKT